MRDVNNFSYETSNMRDKRHEVPNYRTVDLNYPVLPYTKTRDSSGNITYHIYGNKDYTLFNRMITFDPVFLNAGGFISRTISTFDHKIVEACSYFGITPIPIEEGFGESLPRGLLPPPPTIVTVDANYTEMIDRICPSCGDYYTDINRCDLISGKHLICDRCKHTIINPNIVVNSDVRNVCGNCGLIYNSIVHEDFCSYHCQVKLDTVKFILPKFDGNIVSYEDLEIVKSYKTMQFNYEESPDSLVNDIPIDMKVDLGDKPRVKMTSVIHRVCPDCSVVYETTRAMLKKNRGVLCKDHAKKHRVTPRVSNTCLSCGITFDSIVKEDYCSEECKDIDG